MSVIASGIAVAPIGAVTLAAMPWRDRGQLRVAAIVKATFAFAADAPMGLLEPEPIYDDEVHHQNNPARSIRSASDLCPHLPRADVILTGHAHAPSGATATRVVTRLLLLERERVLLDKALQIVGDLHEGGVTPFRRLQITYERAYGGIGHRDNPLGVGAGKDSGSPNIVDPRGPEYVAGYGPISRFWHARRSLISPEQRAAIAKPIAEIIGDFDFRYFQSAPPDQQVNYLRGDEWLVLEGLHPESPRFRTQLPAARAAARFYRHGQAGDEGALLWLYADSLRIDTDAQRCSLAFRGSIELEDERALAGLWLAGGLSLAGQAIRWPLEPPALLEAPKSQSRRVPLPSGTIEISDEEDSTLVKPPRQGTREKDAPKEAQPVLFPPEPPDRTFQLTSTDQTSASRKRVLPFESTEGPAGGKMKPEK